MKGYVEKEITLLPMVKQKPQQLDIKHASKRAKYYTDLPWLLAAFKKLICCTIFSECFFD